MRYFLMIGALATVAACGGGARGATGDISKACLAADRRAASPALCSCVQQVANQSLSGSDQAVERETLQAAIKSFTNASSVWDQAWGLQALQTLPAALRSREPAVSSTDALRKDVADGLAALASLLPYAA